jgi:hypothetical protein
MVRAVACCSALAVLVTACATAPHSVTMVTPSPLPTEYRSAPISTIVLDDYATGGFLTVPAGTEFALELSGSGWTINLPEDYQPYRLVSGPGRWQPDLGFAGPGNCASASPCGGIGAVFRATRSGYTDVTAWSTEGFAFDLHLEVRDGPVVIDMQAVPIVAESFSTVVTAPVGATVDVHLTGDWGPPKTDPSLLKLFGEQHMPTSGVVALVATSYALNETIYSYMITGLGGYGVAFEYREPSTFGDKYEIDFDIR